MAKAKLYTGTKAKIDAKAIENGAIYAATDKNVLAVDINNKRITLDADAISTNSSNISSLQTTVAEKSDSTHTHSLSDLSGVAGSAQKLTNSSGTVISTTAKKPVKFTNGVPEAIELITVANDGSSVYAGKLANVSGWLPIDPTNPTTYSIGSSTAPVYFSDGIPVACGSSLAVSITGNAATATSATTAAGLSTTLAITSGGTGATTASAARTNLGLGTAATCSYTTSITSGSSALITSGAVYTGLANKAASDIVVVSSTEPTSSTCQLWIQTS